MNMKEQMRVSYFIGKTNFKFLKLGEPSDAGVGTLLVSNHSTTSTSGTVCCKGEADRR